MSNVLVLFAHPELERSRVHRSLITGLPQLSGVTFRDLYQLYPDFHIDVAREQELLLLHDFIIWQYPMNWYSMPPLLKQWIEMTFEYRWAYGPGGIYLRGKRVMNVLTAGGERDTYRPNRYNRFPVPEFLRPLQQTARRCGMEYLPPYVIHVTRQLASEQVDRERERYHTFLRGVVADRFDTADWQDIAYANEVLDLPNELR
ncbi:glutathione-regulated potassium-efflux system ancillary protein KefG [Lewinella aquimaris]|uniref:Glutathione-regulated potassium-efflux system ancillary protein KefG n=1 Tax=Neolewinella aquimaris TaxID=1835722 RepID=A0A840DX58_9BACT|nr:NAD(P)H-dependent oxidoreductase [Neolewinella aquimaris]MBB4077520.1 glutathione-regulated potassium-efflux system ancillary protein KefG [Neolewinella aquimaris]